MRRICLLDNPIREYAWGSPSVIPELLGHPNPGGVPQAELWMGAHPLAPSRVALDEGRCVPLDRAIAADPAAALGASVARRFRGRLPFLFKVLAVERPLSIQAHPDVEQAARGFERENAAGLPLDAPRRNYRDPEHKPELLCALTPFTALVGFRPISRALGLLGALDCPTLAGSLARFRGDPTPAGQRGFLGGLLRLDGASRERLVAEARAAAAARADEDPAFAWVARLAEEYPGDGGVLGPLLLRLVELRPGEALFLPARRLHAYLRGAGIELMANSDNVLRGGLTPKHVDVDELLRVVSFGEDPLELLRAERLGKHEWRYRAPVGEFELSRIELDGREVYRASAEHGVEILLVVEGRAVVRGPAVAVPLALARGRAAFVPAAAGAYVLEGTGRLFRAAVPAV